MVAVKPISLRSVVLVFLGTLVPILVGVYVVLPRLLASGVPFFVGYIVCFQTVPMLFILVLALVLYRSEGNPLSWKVFKERMRLRMNGKVVLAGIGLLIVGLAGYALLQPLVKVLAVIPLFAPPDWFAAGLHPLKGDAPGTFMGMPMAGVLWAPLVYLIGWFFNIAGEELLFRGYLLPRMEQTHGRIACLVNSTCWFVWHCFWRWQLVALIPIIFLLPLVAQKTRSTIPGMIAHGAMNLVAVIMIALIVF
jgi:membrane protease YdiL (CAAX protease family)